MYNKKAIVYNNNVSEVAYIIVRRKILLTVVLKVLYFR